jgi:amino acid transporter
MIGLTAGESKNPARDVPKAVRFVFWRVLIIFMGGIFFISLCVPWTDPNLLSGTSKTARSPFVISFVNAGLPQGGDVINAVIVSRESS